MTTISESFTPREFERVVGDLLRTEGYREIELVGGAGDLGVDLRCRDKHGRLVVVQCKRYRDDSSIGSPDIQRFFGMMVHHGAAAGIFATSARFTRAARDLADQRDIRLIDGAQLQAHSLFAKNVQPELASPRDASRATQEPASGSRSSWLSRALTKFSARPSTVSPTVQIIETDNSATSRSQKMADRVQDHASAGGHISQTVDKSAVPTVDWRTASGEWNAHAFHFAIYSRGGHKPQDLEYPDGRYYKTISFPEARSAQAYGDEVLRINGGAEQMRQMRFKLSIYRNSTLIGAWFEGEWTGRDPNLILKK